MGQPSASSAFKSAFTYRPIWFHDKHSAANRYSTPLEKIIVVCLTSPGLF
jgi:hypothetical protein